MGLRLVRARNARVSLVNVRTRLGRMKVMMKVREDLNGCFRRRMQVAAMMKMAVEAVRVSPHLHQAKAQVKTLAQEILMLLIAKVTICHQKAV